MTCTYKGTLPCETSHRKLTVFFPDEVHSALRPSSPPPSQLMRPQGVVLELGTPPGSPTRTSSDFEEISYPPSYHSTRRPTARQEEELPLHYMTEDKARRRVVRGPGGTVSPMSDTYPYADDDEGKDIMSKARFVKHGVPVGSGRMRHAPPPPAVSIVGPTSQRR